MTFRIGQKVVCVDSAAYPDRNGWRDDSPTAGTVYTVSGFYTSPVDGSGCITLVELKRNPIVISRGVRGYRAFRFRPVKTTDISALTALLSPSPEETRRIAREEAEKDALVSLATVKPWLTVIAQLQEEFRHGE